MREIKFRAWDGNQMHYLEEDHYWTIGYSGYISLVEQKPIPSMGQGENTVAGFDVTSKHLGHAFMQFTGLTDRNGVEIYEGDLLVLNADSDDPADPKPVEWKCLEFSCAGFSLGLFEFDSDVCCEVVGNIYESPELLDQTNG